METVLRTLLLTKRLNFLNFCLVLFFSTAFAVTVSAQGPPVISSFSPASGPVRTTVTVTGSNFDPIAANNIVYFGAVKASVISAASTSLSVTVPPSATYQPITVMTNGLTAYSNKSFDVTFPNTNTAFSTNSFAPKMDYPTGSNPQSVAIGDLDGDGKADLVVANHASTSDSDTSHTISVYRNIGSNGMIAFSEKSDYTTGSQTLYSPGTDDPPNNVVVVDLDGDGKLDLVVSNEFSSSVSVFRNISSSGMISFAAKQNFTVGTLPYLDPRCHSCAAAGSRPRNIAFGDLDGDGKPEVAVRNSEYGSIGVLKNLSTVGMISFAPKIEYQTFHDDRGGLAIGDLDGDGKPELIVASSTVAVFKNTSSNQAISFSARTDFTPPTGFDFYHLAVGDIDGDGSIDLAVIGNSTTSQNSVLSIFRNTTKGEAINFAPQVDFFAGFNSSYKSPFAMGDLDGDGKVDLAFITDEPLISGNAISVFKNVSSIGTIMFTPKIDYPTGAVSDALAIGDLNGDSRPELVVTNSYSYITKSYSNSISIFRNQISTCAPPTFKNDGTIVLNASCANNDGNISIIPTSGTAPFMYSKDGGTTYVSGPDNGYTFANLASGTYRLRLKDGNGCESAIVEREVKLNCTTACKPPTFLNNNLIVLDASCGNNDGQISIIPTSGTAPFMYSIDGGANYKAGANTGTGFTNLLPGTYKLRLEDANGCESAIVERAIRSIYGGPAFTYKTSEATCGNKNGSITIVPSGGAGPFMYSIDAGMTYVEGPATGYTFSNLAANTYYLEIKNAAGCESAIIYEAVKANFSNCSGTTVQASITAMQNALNPEVINLDAIKAYPNPTKGQFKLQLKGFISQKAEVSIFNGEGRIVQKRQSNSAGTNTLDFDLTGQAKGMYYIKITSNSGTRTSKVLVQ